MKNKLIKVSSVITIAADIFMASGWSFFKLMIKYRDKKKLNKKKWFKFSKTKINHPRDKFEKEYEEGKEWCKQQNMHDCYIKSIDGLKLHASYLPTKDAKRFVILCHGYKGSGFGDFAYTARFLHENNCNLLFIDQRCCGESQGEYITFGAKEQYDIQKWSYYIAKRNKKKLPVYLYGESMGAASVLMASGHKLPKYVKGLIADCGFRSMKGQLRDLADDWFHLKHINLMLFRVDLLCNIFARFKMCDADTSHAMITNKRPVLFFHGLTDTYVSSKNSKANYLLCQAPKELVMIPNARHLCSPYVAKNLYRDKLLNFFEKYD